MLTVPTVAQLANFSGVDAASYTSYASTALTLSTLLFMIRSEIWNQSEIDALEQPLKDLELNGILSMADHMYLEQPYRQATASPFQSESIGSYSYSKPVQYHSAAALRGLRSEDTGVLWFDLAMQMLAKRTVAGGVYVGQIQCFELSDTGDQGIQVMVNPISGQVWLQGPADRDLAWGPFGFDINADVGPMP